jgi:hypothetical protein
MIIPDFIISVLLTVDILLCIFVYDLLKRVRTLEYLERQRP